MPGLGRLVGGYRAVACHKARDERGVGQRLRRPMRVVQVALACWGNDVAVACGGTVGSWRDGGNLVAQRLVHPVTVVVELAGGDCDDTVLLGANHLAVVVDRPRADCAARLVLDAVSDLGGCHSSMSS